MSSRTPPPPPRRSTLPVGIAGSASASHPIREGPGADVRLGDYEHYVQLDTQGELLSGHGQTEQLASVAAYVSNVADVVGRMLQFGHSVAVEAKFQSSALFVLSDADGRIVGVKARGDMNLQRLRAQLKL
jgi:hypothetical protein